MTAKIQPAVETGKICFSYIRFSSVKQASGDSETRQAEIAPRIAKEKGWRLRTDLNLADLGLSAFKKQNVGSLKAVQAGAESGKIPKGFVMIIEALDRLTRAELDTALDIFRGILRAGLEIYVDKSSKHYTRDSLNNITDLIISVVELAAANDYSAKLADRVASAWKRKRDRLATGQKLTKRVPSWIDKNTWQPIPDKVAIVKRVFTMYANGVGRSTITRTLNHEKVTPLAKAAWSDTSIHNILHSRAVIGEFTPYISKVSNTGNYYNRIKAGEPIKNYFPTVIPEDLFFRVQLKLSQNKSTVKSEKVRNLFAGIAFCTCGAAMRKTNGRRYSFYTCYNKINGLECDMPTMQYAAIEAGFKALFMRVPELLVANKDNSAQEELDTLQGRLQDCQTKIANITQFVSNGLASESLVREQLKLESEAKELKEQIDNATVRIRSAKPDSEQAKQIISKLPNLDNDTALRRQVREWLHGNVEKMVFNGVKMQFAVAFRNGVTALWQFKDNYKSGEAIFIQRKQKAPSLAYLLLLASQLQLGYG